MWWRVSHHHQCHYRQVAMPRTPKIKPYTPKEAFDILAAYYGPRPWYSRNPPMRELVITILAQHTSDTNAERAIEPQV